LVALLTASPLAAEQAWVKDYHRLNLRSGPGLEFRIRGSLETGNEVKILERGDGWTRIQVTDLGEGWIPEGYLQSVAPARVRLEDIEKRSHALRGELEALSERAKRLETDNRGLLDRDAEQSATLREVSSENVALRAGARWPHWIAGASILAFGMLVGIVVQSLAGRRSRRRIRI
jgi:uncharacterized protein YgiM (DUF1202 family)